MYFITSAGLISSIHYSALYIISDRQNGAYLEAVGGHGGRITSLVAHCDYDCAVDNVIDYSLVETPEKGTPSAPKKKNNPKPAPDRP